MVGDPKFMAEEKKSSLKDLKEVLESNSAAEKEAVNNSEHEISSEAGDSPADKTPQIDDLGRSYATGKRKDAVARVWLKPGPGKVVVNGKNFEAYFARPVLQMLIKQPFQAVEREGQYDVFCTVKGGGLSGQAGALKHGISKALTLFEPSLRGILKKAGYLTRDSRVVERKKYGRRKARRSFQFSKR